MKNPDRKNKIGLALGGSGARAAAHIGVLEVLEKNKIPISVMAGTSMGAMVGGMYASGVPLRQIHDFFVGLHQQHIFSESRLAILHESMLPTAPIYKLLKALVLDLQIEESKIPFTVNVVDLESGKEYGMEKGPLLDTLVAAMAYPPLFAPVFLQGRYLVDASIFCATPVHTLRAECDSLIAVNVNDFAPRQYLSAMAFTRFLHKEKGWKKWLGGWFNTVQEADLLMMLNVMMRVMNIASRQNNETNLTAHKADLIIEPDVGSFSLFAFDHCDEIIALGRDAATKALPALLSLNP